MSSQLSSGNTSLLAETHAILSALKVLVSTSSVESIETARRSMGGHGFSVAAGIGRLYAEHVPSTTLVPFIKVTFRLLYALTPF